MSELIENLCALRREQMDSPHLLSPTQFTSWVNKAENRLKRLQALKPEYESPGYVEADSIVINLEDIQQRRAELIWALAYDQAGDISLMTEHEADIYRDLLGYASDLKGDA